MYFTHSQHDRGLSPFFHLFIFCLMTCSLPSGWGWLPFKKNSKYALKANLSLALHSHFQLPAGLLYSAPPTPQNQLVIKSSFSQYTLHLSLSETSGKTHTFFLSPSSTMCKTEITHPRGFFKNSNETMDVKAPCTR